MSYALVPSALGALGASTPAIDLLSEQAAEKAQSRLGMDAAYAGSVQQGSAEALGLLYASGKAGKLPTGKQVVAAMAPVASTVSFTAMTAVCAPAAGPAAPLCGMAAAAVTDALFEAIASPGGSSCRINGIDCSAYWAGVESNAVAACAPGDTACQDEMRPLVRGFRDAWWKQLTGARAFEILSEVEEAVARRAMASRIDAEARFLRGVEIAASTLAAPYVGVCPTVACIEQVTGLARKTAFDAGIAMRDGTGGAALILSAAGSQLRGLVASEQEQGHLASAATAQLRDQIRTQLEVLAKVDAQRNAAVAADAASERSARTALAVAGGVAAAAGVVLLAYGYLKRRRKMR